MAGLKAIKSKIRSVEKTRKVTKAMEAVSAAKMRKAQSRAFSGRAYARAAASILARVSGSRELARHPLTEVREVTNLLYVVITSDKGLAGALNSAVLRAVSLDIQKSGVAKEHITIIAVGRKANDFFLNRGYRIEAYHPNTDDVTAETISTLVHEAAGDYATKRVDTVKIAYQNFISTFEQRPTIRTVFPLGLGELEQVVADIKLIKAPGAGNTNGTGTPATYTVEPSEEVVLQAILPRLASVFVHHALLETQASEHSARMVAMKSASDKAEEMTHSLTLKFNKARQASITREVSEITGGMEAMAN